MSMVAGGGAWMQQPRAFQSETYFFAARVVAQGRATACLRHDKSSSTLQKCQITKTARFIPSIQPLVCLCLEIYSTCACVELPLSSPTRIWSCCHHRCACEAYSTVCSFIIVSSSNPTGLMISNKPYFLKAFWLYC